MIPNYTRPSGREPGIPFFPLREGGVEPAGATAEGVQMSGPLDMGRTLPVSGPGTLLQPSGGVGDPMCFAVATPGRCDRT